jgi:hypothetical protein
MAGPLHCSFPSLAPLNELAASSHEPFEHNGTHCTLSENKPQQLAVLKRKHPRPTLGGLDKLFWLLAHRFWPHWKKIEEFKPYYISEIPTHLEHKYFSVWHIGI